MDFIKNRHKFFVISGLLLLMTVCVWIYRGGPNYGIDFTGGIFMQVSFQKEIALQTLRSALEENGMNSFELQSAGSLIMIRAKKNLKFQEEFEESVRNSVQLKFPDNPMKVEKIEYVGPTVGRYLSKQVAYAFFFAFLGIVAYVAIRFKSSLWGIVAIIGIIHDVFISFGCVVLANKEVDITVIAALLTVAGYSINDTVVLFERIKENLKLIPKGESFASVINKSIGEVLIRSVVTSLTVFIVACSLFFFGGGVIHTFAYIMVIGTVLGVFSSLFICIPFVYELETRRNKRRLKAV
jgi:preprotein translocase subunit SecF